MVCADTDKDKVLAIAELETHDRAGKYGVQVTCDDEIVAYFPSSRAEERLSMDYYTYADLHLGAFVRMKPSATNGEIQAELAHQLVVGQMIRDAELKSQTKGNKE